MTANSRSTEKVSCNLAVLSLSAISHPTPPKLPFPYACQILFF